MTSRIILCVSAVFLVGGPITRTIAAPGRVGCFYDLKLCEANELCYNDALFGTCVTQMTDAVSYSELPPEALTTAANILQYLIETGYKWQDSYAQCVVGKFLQAATTGEQYDPNVCEYLKALLDVIDQNRPAQNGQQDQPPAIEAVIPVDSIVSFSQNEPDIMSMVQSAPAEPSQPHGEFMTSSDFTDFDAPVAVPSQEQAQLPSRFLEQPMGVVINSDQNPMAVVQVENPNNEDAVSAYIAAYQQALLQAQQQQQQEAQAAADSSNMQKKSDPAVLVLRADEPTATTTPTPTEATTTPQPDVTTTSMPDDALMSELNNTNSEAADAEAMQALVSLMEAMPQVQAQPDEPFVGMPQDAILVADPRMRFINEPQQQPQITPDDITIMLMMQQQQPQGRQMMPLQFSDDQGLQLVPDFSAPAPLSPQEYMLAQSIYGPMIAAQQQQEQMQQMQQMQQIQQMQQLQQLQQLAQMGYPGPVMPRGADQVFMDPRARRGDPMMMQQMQVDPRMMDPRMMDPRMMDPSMFQQMPNPSMMGPYQGYPMDPSMMGYGPQMNQMDPITMAMAQGVDPRVLFGQGFGMNPNMMSSPPPMVMPRNDMFMEKRGGMPSFARMPDFGPQGPPPFMMQQQPQGPPPGFMDQRLLFQSMPPPYGLFPQDVAYPFMQMQNQWQPPMAMPEGILIAEQIPIMVDVSANESSAPNPQLIQALFGETEQQVANGGSIPSSPNKKDQEYHTMLPSDPSQDQQVVVDETFTVVKGSADQAEPEETVVTEADDDNSDDGDSISVQDADYVFLITKPQLNYDEARYLLNWLSVVLNMPPNTFYDMTTTSDGLITFRVNPVMEQLNATFIAQTLGGEELRSNLRSINNLQIVRAGVGRYSMEESTEDGIPQLQFQQTAVVQSESAAAAEAEIAKKYDVVDPTFAFIVTDPALTYDKARRVLNWLAAKLQVPHTIFSSLHIEDNQLLFRVSPYFSQMNASGVVDRLSDANIQTLLRQEFQVEIIRAGIGDRVQIVKADNKQRQNLLIGLVAVACVAALLISLGIIYLIRRNSIMRKKLYGMGGDVESSKEYEELCRQRMASKNLESNITGSPEKGAVDRTTHSSTSSWSEEPAPTNMDITTGHMVLSYMEDHLAHKDRMNKEWESLTTYEADPRCVEAGSKLENLIKNRYPDVLPYDHTRVHLNPDANITKSDYINANFIVDSDPKNPTYIATQGPLPETVADFWQMVWERNSTAIVMLTKLREHDQDLCHIYWPKEGSEVYHNFEVHLVSEHIWCDDYLVRNFYLKNLKSNETRTVTQFHYLNWPNLGVPSSLKTFLEFRRKVNKCYKGGSSPIVVHCSDGVDRTGAYCLIDLVLNRMAKGVKEIDIAATLEHLRDQRADVVRTKEQFEFVLTAVAQEIQAILKSMPQK